MSPAVARTVVLGGFLLALALGGRPAALVVVLTLALAAVWAAPLLLASRRRRAPVIPAGEVSVPADDQVS